jgi:hypothetical protein
VVATKIALTKSSRGGQHEEAGVDRFNYGDSVHFGDRPVSTDNTTDTTDEPTIVNDCIRSHHGNRMPTA